MMTSGACRYPAVALMVGLSPIDPGILAVVDSLEVVVTAEEFAAGEYRIMRRNTDATVAFVAREDATVFNVRQTGYGYPADCLYTVANPATAVAVVATLIRDGRL